MPVLTQQRGPETVLQVETAAWSAELALSINANLVSLRDRESGLELGFQTKVTP